MELLKMKKNGKIMVATAIAGAIVLGGFHTSNITHAASINTSVVTKIKEDPEIVDIIKTTILFNKNRFEGPHHIASQNEVETF
jgi:hypothetical protein